MKPAQIHVWRIDLDTLQVAALPAASDEEDAYATRLRFAEGPRRYLAAHRALRAILQRETGLTIELAAAPNGKPYLPAAPHWQFNLSHSAQFALVGVALETEVGVDVERIRPMPDCLGIADRFFPPSEAAALADVAPAQREREFFRCWTRLEASWKATGEGLQAAGRELEGEWTVQQIDWGEAFVAAVAAPRAGLAVVVHDFGADQ